MISKNTLNQLKLLRKKEYRIRENKILIEGTRLIGEAINAKASIDILYYSNHFLNNKNNQSLFDLAKNKKISTVEVSQKNIDKLSDSITNPGIIGLVKLKKIKEQDNLYNQQLILDSISDPGNLGNLMRTAEWFGLKNIFLSENSVDPYNSKVIRSAMGAHFYINIIEINIMKHLQNLKNKKFTIIGTAISGENLHRWKDIPPNYAIILGNEAHGISKEIHNLLDFNISIPKKGNIESLNVAMAGGILLSHIANNVKDN